eukprot:7820345-Alexandrium_andersonii.AAC.1
MVGISPWGAAKLALATVAWQSHGLECAMAASAAAGLAQHALQRGTLRRAWLAHGCLLYTSPSPRD